MILDKLENADAYFACVPGFEQFMNFFNNNDMLNLPACKIKINGDDLFVNINDFTGKKEEDCRMEAHKEYIDIQIPLNNDEQMGWKAQEDCKIIISPYNEQKDVEFYGDKASAMLTVPAGHFAVFFPEDAHQPGIAEGCSYRKLIVKAKDLRSNP
ncbi:MAG: YhcH/YjgK/YiaL family protein [Paludibacter sp.]|nr:YhcH/YjgK/YiaL family protein [Bacteroidales bacterium]MCM1068572.1 YhcH/YjgK/YiaL family protein [Prevotella sp.]MCM1353236.1 YhcH/YjgK/YiaL family protein [Bacteroides sp.]MCM1442356.1 YhcH/YjgK/YiaL family protein [Muribaculum sp.]MCM1481175.1 YhcH/YjgK/YiaL family protein [Paludibacter sp.]